MHFVQLREEAGDDELKESCLQAFEALALRCFREITPYIKEVWSIQEHTDVRLTILLYVLDCGGVFAHAVT